MTFSGNISKEFKLNNFRYKHIGEVMDAVATEFKTFVANNSTAKFQAGQS
jgi:hypothetical protein